MEDYYLRLTNFLESLDFLDSLLLLDYALYFLALTDIFLILSLTYWLLTLNLWCFGGTNCLNFVWIPSPLLCTLFNWEVSFSINEVYSSLSSLTNSLGLLMIFLPSLLTFLTFGGSSTLSYLFQMDCFSSFKLSANFYGLKKSFVS